MNWLCWLIDHDWHPSVYRDRIECRRCLSLPYEDTTLPDWFRDRRVVERLRRFAKRVRLYVVSRKCWKPGHDWSPLSDRCQRCGMTGAEDAERGEWMLPEWKKLWRAWLSDRFGILRRRPQDFTFGVWAFNWTLGFERSLVTIRGEKYMMRYIVYFGPGCLRLHRFYRGDDDRASHTHPWAFITFPFAHYVERRFKEGTEIPGPHYVKRFRFHYRPRDFEHIVLRRVCVRDVDGFKVWYADERPFWTFVITGPKVDDWGFYPKPGKFVYWRDYK